MILTSGEALIDMLPRETAGGEAAFAPFAGGAVFNTAIALGRLGAPVAFFSGLSTDLFGTQLQEALTAAGVDASPCARSDRPTTLAFVTLTDGQARYAFYDENTAGRLLAQSDLPAPSDAISAAFFGGISLMVEPCGATYEAFMLREAPHRVTMLDPNIRPDFIADEAAYRARMDRMLAVADIVKVSDEDLHWLMGDGEPVDLARALLDRGPKAVFVTLGAEGAMGVTGEAEPVFEPSTKVEVVDTVGAGDTFNAGVLAALHDRGLLSREGVAGLSADDLSAALRLGGAAAAITVSRAGANPPWRHELGAH